MPISVHSVTIDCHHPIAVANFWAAVFGRSVADGASDYFAQIPAGADGPGMMFIAVPEGKTAKNRMHLDLSADDRPAEVARLVALGAAVKAEHAEHGFAWTTLVDVEGNEFCVASA
jgi:predicted enzyme related to lactoylglutathione lyase